jgi:hypothetical protein
MLPRPAIHPKLAFIEDFVAEGIELRQSVVASSAHKYLQSSVPPDKGAGPASEPKTGVSVEREDILGGPPCLRGNEVQEVPDLTSLPVDYRSEVRNV